MVEGREVDFSLRKVFEHCPECFSAKRKEEDMLFEGSLCPT